MEELQALWHKASVREESPVTRAELDRLVSQRSSDELQRFRRVIVLECATTWLIVPFLLCWVFWRPEQQRAAIPLLALVGGILYFYHRALHQFNRIHYEDSIQTYLQRALTFLKTYVRHLKVFYWASGTVGFGVGYFWAGSSEAGDDYLFLPSPFWNLVITLAGVAGIVLFLHLYIKYLYQARIDKLEQLLRELSEN